MTSDKKCDILYLEGETEMITELSKRISLFLCRKNIIAEDLIEVYQYGFETIISTLLGFFITVIIGITFRMTLLSLFYYFIFVILRQFTGGYHADTYLKCNLIFAATTVFIFGMSKMAAIGDIYTIGFHLLILVFSIMVIWIKAPVENENKPLSEKQKIRNHWFSVITAMVLAIISGFLYKEAVLVSALIAFTLFVVAVMTVIATPKGKEE